MLNFLRRIFARITVEEQRLQDLEEAEFLLLDACKQLEYYRAIAEAAKVRIARLNASIAADVTSKGEIK